MATPNHCRIPVDTNQVWMILGYSHFSKPANCSVSTPRCSFQNPGGLRKIQVRKEMQHGMNALKQEIFKMLEARL